MPHAQCTYLLSSCCEDRSDWLGQEKSSLEERLDKLRCKRMDNQIESPLSFSGPFTNPHFKNSFKWDLIAFFKIKIYFLLIKPCSFSFQRRTLIHYCFEPELFKCNLYQPKILELFSMCHFVKHTVFDQWKNSATIINIDNWCCTIGHYSYILPYGVVEMRLLIFSPHLWLVKTSNDVSWAVPSLHY